jgi:hypothetical protein
MKTFAGLLCTICLHCFLRPTNVAADVPTPPPPNRILDVWSFDKTNFVSLRGARLKSFFGIESIASWNGSAMKIEKSHALLSYNEIEPTGQLNIRCENGALQFWFRPNWNSGEGPGSFARLVELGTYTTNASVGWWSLYLDDGGTNLYFSAQTNGLEAIYLSAPIRWVSNRWYLLTLSYSSAESALYIDGELAASGSGVSYWPDAAVRSNGFAIGSDLQGGNVANGEFEQFETWAGPLRADLPEWYYNDALERWDPNQELRRAGQIFYHVTFDSPLNTVNQPPTTGPGTQTPSRIVGTPTVMTALPHMQDQPLAFDPIGLGDVLQQVDFDLARGSSAYFVELDFEVQPLAGWVSRVFNFFVFFQSTNGSWGRGFSSDDANFRIIPDGGHYHLRLDVSPSRGTWAQRIDDGPTTYGYAAIGEISSLAIGVLKSGLNGLPDGREIVRVGVDNIIIGTSDSPAVPIAPTITCPPPSHVEYSNARIATLVVQVEDLGHQALEIVWSVDGTAYQTNTIPAGRLVTWSNVSFTAHFDSGEHIVTVSASNGQTTPATCSTTVSVAAPVITDPIKVVASPDILLPANGSMKTVSFIVSSPTTAVQPTSRIIAVSSDDPSASSGRDWRILNALSLKLRAKRARRHAARNYTIAVESIGKAGSCSTNWISVTVPSHPRLRR